MNTSPMKNIAGLTVILSVALGWSGCAFGPLYMHETAQTVGAGKFELAGGYGNAAAVVKVTVGLLDNLDLGLHWESLSIGMRLKYAFINNHEDGLSASGMLGFGESFGGVYYTGAGSVSYLTHVFEPYFAARGVYVSYNSTSSSFSLNGSGLNLPFFSYSYSYLEPIVGSRFWLYEKHLFLSAEVGALFISGGGFVVASGGIGYRF